MLEFAKNLRGYVCRLVTGRAAIKHPLSTVRRGVCFPRTSLNNCSLQIYSVAIVDQLLNRTIPGEFFKLASNICYIFELTSLLYLVIGEYFEEEWIF